MSKKILASIMTFIIFATTLCKLPVFAAITYLDADGVTQNVDNATQITSELTTWTGWVYATGDVTIETRVEISGDVHLILCDNCNLTCNLGIHVSEANSFTIYAQSSGESKGYLVANSTSTTATGYENKAGIGGNDRESNGPITINGGKIDANAIETTATLWGAGIGSGYGEGSSNITINGGKITATSKWGAGIGSGGITASDSRTSLASNITINGGEITTTSTGGAGIGSGQRGNASGITINGGEIKISMIGERSSGAGIGSGITGNASNIEINDGIIEIIMSNAWGAGIGSGSAMTGLNNTLENLRINDGKITIKTFAGACIGGGWKSNASNITIKGGTITATSEAGAGIGGGYCAFGNNITILGGKVTATSTATSAVDPDIVVKGAGIGDGPKEQALLDSLQNNEITNSTGFYTELEGVKGEAIIEASSITDRSNEANWYGKIYMTEDKYRVIGGEQSYDQDIEVENEGTMKINANTNFTQQASLTNNGTIEIPAGSKILCSGTFTNGEVGEVNIDGELNVTGTANWNGTKVKGIGKITPTAAKISKPITMKENLDKVHDGQPADIGALNEIYSVYGEDGAGELSIVYKKDGVMLSEAPTAVGNYSVTASASEGNFYKAAAEKTTNYRITKNIPGVTPPKAIDGLVFDNTEKVLIEAGTATGGTLMYSLDGTKYSADLPTATDAGDYTVYYKVESNETYEGTEAESIPAKIAKATPTITKDPAVIGNLSYTGEPQELITAGTTDGGQLMYKLEGYEYSTTIPTGTDAKTYKVSYKVFGGKNYNDSEETTLSITIAKASIDANEPTAKTDLIYTGGPLQLINPGNATEGKFEYKLNAEDEYSAAIPTGTNAGNYTVYYKFDGGDNYNSIEEKTLPVTIAKADPTFIEEPKAKGNLSYTGEPLELITAGSTNGGQLKYKLENETEYSPTIPVGTEPATYKVYYKVFGDDNYNDLEEKYLTITIAKAASALNNPPTAKPNLVFNGNPLVLIEPGEAAGGTLVYSLDGKEYLPELPTGTNAGDYTVYYKINGDENHSGTDAKPLPVTIAKANPELDEPTVISDLVFTGVAQELITSGSTNGGQLMYKLEENEYSLTIPTGTEAKTYKVYYKVFGGENYNDSAEGTLSITIAKVRSELKTDPTAKTDLVYTGSSLVLIEPGEATGGTLVYSLDGKEYLPELPTGTNAKDYTVYFKVNGDENHSDTDAKTLPVTIAKAEPKADNEPSAKENLVYNGNSQILINPGTATGGIFVYSSDGEKYSTNLPTGTNAKDYTVYFKINGGDNYNDTESKILVITIAKANPEFEIKPRAKANLVYSGNEQQLIEAGEAKENQGHIEYKKDDGTYSENIPVGTDAGTYNIFYKIIGDENYDDSLEENFEVEISKADPKVITPKAKEESLVYTGASQELIEAGKILDLNGEQIGNFKYTVNGQASSDAVPKGTETGKYEIYYKSEFLGDKNYNSVADEGDFTVIIYGAKQNAPAAPQMQKRTQNSIELKIIEANENGSKAEYKIDNGNWQDSSVFKNLTQNKEYTFVARYAAAENGSYAASDASQETKIRTLRSLKGSNQNNNNSGSDYTDDDNQSTEDDNNKEENDNKNDSSNVQDANKNLQISDGETKKFKYENGTANVTLNKSDNIFEIKIFDENGNMLNIHDEIILVIPCESSKSGTVAAQINSDGTRKIIRKSIVRDGKIYLPIKTSGKFEIVDNSKIFYDVTINNWAHDAVAFVSSHELFSGTAPNIFEPKTSMSRVMLTKVLHNLEDNPYQVFEKIFSDVNIGDWFAEAVTWASKNNFILGYDDKKFGSNDNITREQLATILYRYFGKNEIVDNDLNFADANEISDYALKALRWAVANKIVQGKGNNILDPKGLATRAEVAQMFQNLLLNLFYR